MFKIDAKTGTVTWGDFVINLETRLDDFLARYPDLISNQETRESGYSDFRLVETNFQLGVQQIEDQVALGSVGFWDQRGGGFGLNPVHDTSHHEPWWAGLQLWIPAARKWLHTQFGEPHEVNWGVLAGEKSACPPDFVALIDTNWVYRFDWGKVGLYYEPLDSHISLYVVFDIDVQMAREHERVKR